MTFIWMAMVLWRQKLLCGVETELAFNSCGSTNTKSVTSSYISFYIVLSRRRRMRSGYFCVPEITSPVSIWHISGHFGSFTIIINSKCIRDIFEYQRMSYIFRWYFICHACEIRAYDEVKNTHYSLGYMLYITLISKSSSVRKKEIFWYNIFNARIYSHFKSDTNLMVFLKHRTKFTKSLCNGVNTTAIFYVFQGAFVLYRGYKLHKWKSYLIICIFH